MSDTELSTSTSFGKEGSLARSTSLGGIGTKRVSLSVDDITEVEDLNSPQPSTPNKRQREEPSTPNKRRREEPSTPNKKQCNRESILESLTDGVLETIVSKVDHDDLKSLVLVSKTIRDVALIVKETHFEYTTPSKNICKFDDISEEAAKLCGHFAPKPSRVPRSRLTSTSTSNLSVALFKDDDDDHED